MQKNQQTPIYTESILSQHNASTCDIDNFYDNVVAKNLVTSKYLNIIVKPCSDI